MVLWEITLGTAYFLGLKRTYRLALRIQRRLVTPNHPKIRNFLQRRTRAVSDVALKVHQNTRWLDQMKPFAQIRGDWLLKPPSSNTKMTKQTSSSSQLKTHGSTQTLGNQDSGWHLFTASRNTWSKPFSKIAIIMRTPTAGTIAQYRHLSIRGPEMTSTCCNI